MSVCGWPYVIRYSCVSWSASCFSRGPIARLETTGSHAPPLAFASASTPFRFLVSSMGVPPRLKQLADQLTHEYKITYGHPQSLIPPEHVTVEVKRPGLTARGTPVKELKQ